MPHGIYDVNTNKGYPSIGKSRDTSEFMYDNLKYHRHTEISRNYRQADEMLLLMDGGGSNSCLRYIVKENLHDVANQLQISIRVAHYPAYCTKHNPIEQRLFPHLQRSRDGVVFSDYETNTDGARTNEKLYQSGRKIQRKL